MRSKIAIAVLGALALSAPATWADGRGEKPKDKDKDTVEAGPEGRAPKVTICHVPPGNPANRHTISVGAPAWNAHRRHGDYKGRCEDGPPPEPEPKP